jgi:hypothetical protein
MAHYTFVLSVHNADASFRGRSSGSGLGLLTDSRYLVSVRTLLNASIFAIHARHAHAFQGYEAPDAGKTWGKVSSGESEASHRHNVGLS